MQRTQRLTIVLERGMRTPARLPPPLPVHQLIDHEPLRPWWVQATLYSVTNALGLVVIYWLGWAILIMTAQLMFGRGGT